MRRQAPSCLWPGIVKLEDGALLAGFLAGACGSVAFIFGLLVVKQLNITRFRYED